MSYTLVAYALGVSGAAFIAFSAVRWWLLLQARKELAREAHRHAIKEAARAAQGAQGE